MQSARHKRLWQEHQQLAASTQTSLNFVANATATGVPTAGPSSSSEKETVTVVSTSSALLDTTSSVSASLQIAVPATGTRPPVLTSFLHKDDVTKAEIMWTLKAVMSNYSYNSATGLNEFLQAMFPDSEIATKFLLSSTKMAYIIRFGLVPYFHSELLSQVKNCAHFVLAFDKSLNKVTQNGQMDIHIRLFDNLSGNVSTRHLGSQFLGHATEHDHVDKFVDAIKDLNCRKVIQISMDGPSVNWSFIEKRKNKLERDPDECFRYQRSDYLCTMALDKLPNALAEMLVVMGLDESTDMIPFDSGHGCDASFDPFAVALSPQILAALSGHIALFPSLSPGADKSYPPRPRRMTSMPMSRNMPCDKPLATKSLVSFQSAVSRKSDSEVVSSFSDINISSSVKFTRTKIARRKLTCADFAPSKIGKSTVLSVSELPLNNEVLGSLMTFCFPDNFFIHSEMQCDQVHHLVLTNVFGARSYATCLTHYERMLVHRGKDGSWKCRKSATLSPTKQYYKEAYIPYCYVLISNYPYFTTLKDCLSRLLSRLQQNSVEWQHALKEFALHLCSTPVSIAANFQLEFLLFGVVMTLPALSVVGQQPVDFNLGLTFQLLDIQTILYILTALLLQQRIVFLSSSYAVLTIVTESFMRFIFPFRWQTTYVPLLPVNLLELVEAPGTFVMGCHSKHWQFSNNEFPDLVVVSIDQGTLLSPNYVDVPCIPKAALATFKESSKSIARLLVMSEIGIPTSFTYEESRAVELRNFQQLNDSIDCLFINLMANLFGVIMNYINHERRFFHKDQFLANAEETDRPFFENVFKTDLFKSFLNDRLDGVRDAWTDVVGFNSSSFGSSLSLNTPSLFELDTSMRNAQSMPSLPLQEVPCTERPPRTASNTIVYRLPNFMYGLGHLYVETCLKDVGRNLCSSDPSSVRHNAFLYLRGTLLVSQNRRLAAIEDFCQLNQADSRTFTVDLIANTLASMSEDERLSLNESDLYARMPMLKDYCAKVHGGNNEPVLMELNKIPEQQIDLNGFIQLLEMLKICPQRTMAERLFRAFTFDRAQVDPLTFEEFYKSLKQNEVEVREVVLSEEFPFDPSVECILKVSGLVKCTCGNGRVILTQERFILKLTSLIAIKKSVCCLLYLLKPRLLFIQEGSNKCQEIVRLMDVHKIDQIYQQSFFRPKHLALEVLYVRARGEKEKRFVVSFREESYKWFLFINEMWSGKRLSEELEDSSILMSAKQNVLIVDAFLRSGELEMSSHHNRMMEISPSLCYYMAKAAQPPESLSTETLLRILDPSNDMGSTRQTVDALLFTNDHVLKDTGEVVRQRLWCALSNRSLAVYNVQTWHLESNDIKFDARLTCLLETSANQIWAGSFNSAVFIVDNCKLLKLSDTLFGHSDVVSCMTMDNNGRIYSACLNGQILVWESSTKNVCQKLMLSFEDDEKPVQDMLRSIWCHNSCLWCGTRRGLYVMSLQGDVLSYLSADQEPHSLTNEMKCFLIVKNNQLWIGMGKSGHVRIYDIEKLDVKEELALNCHGIASMISVENEIWIGSKQGSLYVYNASTFKRERQLDVHADRVCSVCAAPDRFIFTGSGSSDGRIAVWKWPSPAII